MAGTGVGGYNGDGILATSADLYYPYGITFDGVGDLFIGDAYNNRIRKVTISTGIISTVAGTGVVGYNGDGILATNADLNDPLGISFDGVGDLFIADTNNHRIRKVTISTGIISTVAGTGVGGYNGDGILATGAKLNYPYGISFDGVGDLFIADRSNQRIRKVTISTGIISTVAVGT